MARRRSGPIAPIRCMPTARSDWMRQEIAEQRAVGDIDRKGPAQDVRRAGPDCSAPARRARRDLRPSEMASPASLGNIGGIAQSEIEALRADRRHHMGGFADQRDAVAGELLGPLDRQREQMAAGLDLDAAEDRMRLLLARLGQFVVAQRHQPLGFRGAETQTTLQRSPGRGTNTQGPCGVWNSVETLRCGPRVADVEGQRRLRADRGGVTAMPAASRHSECRPSAPTTSRADSNWPLAVRIATSSASRTIVSASSSKRVRPESSAARSSSASHQRAVVDVVAELVEADFVPRRTAPPARGTAGRYRRRAAWSAARPPCRWQRGQTSSRSRRSMEAPSSAVVRLSA